MVLEALTTPFKAESNPKRQFFIGFAYVTVAIFLCLWIFRSYSSMIMVFLATMAALPLAYSTIKMEEEKDLEAVEEKWLLKEHAKALSFFMYLFMGMTVAMAFWYVALPADTVAVLFQSQSSTINTINASAIAGNAYKLDFFGKIFFNNVKVLIFCILFSFIYGAGAIFILAWNASVIGAAIGNFVRGNLAAYSHLAGLDRVAKYLYVVSFGLFKYSIHGIPEILSYFTAGLAGGIISVAVIRHDFGTPKFEQILLDSADLLLASFAILFLAAILEVYVT